MQVYLPWADIAQGAECQFQILVAQARDTLLIILAVHLFALSKECFRADPCEL